jgi:hypothetical protein
MHLNETRENAFDMEEGNYARLKIVKRVLRAPLISVLHMVVDTVVRMNHVTVCQLIIKQETIVRNMVVDIFVNIQIVKPFLLEAPTFV